MIPVMVLYLEDDKRKCGDKRRDRDATQGGARTLFMREAHVTRRGTFLRENSPGDLSARDERLVYSVRDINYEIWGNK